jgi:Cd2+/Zn2+-exporting ATPase
MEKASGASGGGLRRVADVALTQFEVRDSNCFGEGARERCARCLREQLLGTAGVQAVSLRHRDGGKATLELEYEPAVVALGEIEKRVKSAGACLGGDRIEVIMGLEGMVSPRSEAVVEGVLARLPGVVASASYSGRSLRVEFDRNLCAMPEIARRLSEVGFRITARPPADEPSAPKAESIVRRIFTWLLHHREMATAIFGLIFLIGAVVTRYFHGPAALRYVFVALSFVIAGWYTAKDTLTILLRPNFDIDVLMFAAAIGAAVLGQYEEGAFLLVLFAFGGAGEEMAMDKARRAIEALGRLTPETATVRDADGSERLVKVEQLGVGDRVVVRPFERVAADGQVESGASAVDESAITGESIPA